MVSFSKFSFHSRAPTSSTTSQTSSPYNGASSSKENKHLDILFLQDATGSQDPYIKSARSAIQDICDKVSSSTSLSRGSIRFGLIAFRDHPPQDNSWVTKDFGFTSDVATMRKNLDGLIACGGGDGPEAQTAALAEALNMEWSEDATRIVILITDAPPHGLGEFGDGFEDSPDQNDPLHVVRQMAERGITLYVITCEPTLSTYEFAIDFYQGISQITSGRVVPLLNAAQLGDYIAGSAVETIETEVLIGEFQDRILEDVYNRGKSIEEVTIKFQKELTGKNVRINTLQVEDVYDLSGTSEYNTSVYIASSSLRVARNKTKRATGPRLKVQFSTGSGFISSVLGGSWGSMRSRPAVSLAPVPRGIPREGSRSALRPPPPPPPSAGPAGPAGTMAPQAIDESQTKRIVMQSLMRSSKVGPGNVLTPIGKYSSKSQQAELSEPAPAPVLS